MQTARSRTPLALLILLSIAALVAWMVVQQFRQMDAGDKPRGRDAGRPAPVEVARVEQGAMDQVRIFTGALEARAEFVVAPKVSGRVDRMHVELADVVRQGQVVAELDNAEFVQDVARAEADLAVARANQAEAESLLAIAQRELDRFDELSRKGVSSESLRDGAKGEQLAKHALVQVSKARILRAQADVEAARIRLGYTLVRADWRGGGEQRVVAERYVDEGETVSANSPLLRIVELDPITAVFSITEKDYGWLRVGQNASLSTDAHPGETFEGRIERIAPVFMASTRQARVELSVNNPGSLLKPGMFARATIILRHVEATTIIPEQALVIREDREGVFLISEDGSTVHWRPVSIGIRQRDRVEVLSDDIRGRVVTLGQQLLNDGSPVQISGSSLSARP